MNVATLDAKPIRFLVDGWSRGSDCVRATDTQRALERAGAMYCGSPRIVGITTRIPNDAVFRNLPE